MKKRLLSILTAAVVLVSAVTLNVMAADENSVTLSIVPASGVDTTALEAGDTITVNVSAPEIAMCSLQFATKYDADIFELVDGSIDVKGTYSSEVGYAMFTAGWPEATTDSATSGRVGYAMAKATNVTPDSDWYILTYQLKVKTDAPAGSVEKAIYMDTVTGGKSAYFTSGDLADDTTKDNAITLVGSYAVTVAGDDTPTDPDDTGKEDATDPDDATKPDDITKPDDTANKDNTDKNNSNQGSSVPSKRPASVSSSSNSSADRDWGAPLNNSATADKDDVDADKAPTADNNNSNPGTGR